LATVPIIFLTALDDEESRLQGFDRMADDYLTKPIRSGLLLSKIRNLLRLTKLRRQKAESQAQKELKIAWQEKNNLAEKFRLFVPDQFLRRIAPEGVDSIQVGNVREEEVTILFCDIRAFTAIAEGQDPKSTFAWLNAFFDQMNEAISLHHGFIDKFLGDAIMAVFDREQDHPADAIAAALQMEKNLQLFNQELDDYRLENPLKMGIGIHTGTAVIGTIGASSRMDSTVIGDVVNTASRLEELTKTYNCNIIASGQTRTRLREEIGIIWQKLDVIQPRGKQQAIDIYQVIGVSQ
jgi:two-component system sensor histidine kinase ChiS